MVDGRNIHQSNGGRSGDNEVGTSVNFQHLQGSVDGSGRPLISPTQRCDTREVNPSVGRMSEEQQARGEEVEN